MVPSVAFDMVCTASVAVEPELDEPAPGDAGAVTELEAEDDGADEDDEPDEPQAARARAREAAKAAPVAIRPRLLRIMRTSRKSDGRRRGGAHRYIRTGTPVVSDFFGRIGQT